MVVEHVFVTTLESHDAMQTAVELLTSRGFVAEAKSAFQMMQSEWNSLEVRRGKPKAARAKSTAELPQRLRLEWDRGRVTIAASIEPKGSYFTSSAKRKDEGLQSDLLTAIAKALEGVLAHRQSMQDATIEWDRVEDLIAETVRRSKRRSMVGLLLVAFIIAFVVVLIIALASS